MLFLTFTFSFTNVIFYGASLLPTPSHLHYKFSAQAADEAVALAKDRPLDNKKKTKI
jgi:hypothetical protein